MLRSWLIFLALALSVLRLASAARGQGEPPAKPHIVVTSTAGFRAEFLGELAYCEQRYLTLAGGVPAKKYSRRTAEGMRSVGGLFAHV